MNWLSKLWSGKKPAPPALEKQLELLEAQNKKFAKIETYLMIIVISLVIAVGFLAFLRLKRKIKPYERTNL